jgi:hypothetical protein
MENNKGRRNELTQLKFKKRLKQCGLDFNDLVAPNNLCALKTTGTPCSCFMCTNKYKRKEKHKTDFLEEL